MEGKLGSRPLGQGRACHPETRYCPHVLPHKISSLWVRQLGVPKFWRTLGPQRLGLGRACPHRINTLLPHMLSYKMAQVGGSPKSGKMGLRPLEMGACLPRRNVQRPHTYRSYQISSLYEKLFLGSWGPVPWNWSVYATLAPYVLRAPSFVALSQTIWA